MAVGGAIARETDVDVAHRPVDRDAANSIAGMGCDGGVENRPARPAAYKR
ncbi:MAG: hypothetical protein AB1749_12990 [Pseudomonadota bacterium]